MLSACFSWCEARLPLHRQLHTEAGGDAVDRRAPVVHELFVRDGVRLDSVAGEPGFPGCVVIEDVADERLHVVDIPLWRPRCDVALLPEPGLFGATPRDGLAHDVFAP